jgi:hypothetical protein
VGPPRLRLDPDRRLPRPGGENPKLDPSFVYAITRGETAHLHLAMASTATTPEASLREAGIDPDAYFR